jgi:acetolactate synthase-1/2/3 large subunit
MNGGTIIGEVLKKHGVEFIFTLCGGHISPILVGSDKAGIKVVDVRDEKNAVFAADAVARMTGIPGVAAVTAGPGLTNTITSIKNAQMAQSPLIIFGGATATVLKGRGSLQDIDQMSLMAPHVKWATSLKSVKHIAPTLERAFRIAQAGVPGPVFIEVPVDLLYNEETVREWYMKETGVDKSKAVGAKLLKLYLNRHLGQIFGGAKDVKFREPIESDVPAVDMDMLKEAAEHLNGAQRPVLVLGSQTMIQAQEAHAIAAAVTALGIPTFLGGMARGLLGTKSDIQFKHKRSAALKNADVVIIAGFPFDFRLGYGRSINSKATVIAANRSALELRKNRRPSLAIQCDAGRFIQSLADNTPRPHGRWDEWIGECREREVARDTEIAEQAKLPATEYINPLLLCTYIEKMMAKDSVIVVDGGDFVATAAYICKPRSPLSWLDPGVFGTLGVGGGFAVGAALCRPKAETWIIWGDGSAAYSLAEFDTCVRHGLPVIAVVGTDASWQQIAREQVEILGTPLGTELRRTDYHKVAEGYGGKGLLLDDPKKIPEVIAKAKKLAAKGHPVLINAQIGETDFRKGSISM